MQPFTNLYKQDHIQEIIDKWKAIDDEIWAKIICMERNRRIAKAYARKHTLTVNGSEEEYLDGTTLGLNSFDNPERDTKTRHIKQYIGQGIRIKITQDGDILVKRMSKANVFVHRLDLGNSHGSSGAAKMSNSSSDLYTMNSDSGELYGLIEQQKGPLNNRNTSTHYDWLTRNGNGKAQSSHLSASNKFGQASQPSGANSSGISSASSSGGISSAATSKLEAGKVGAGAKLSSVGPASDGTRSTLLELNRPVKIFDMSKFKAILERESKKPCPNRKRLQSQCISIISFVLDDQKMLNLPSWILIINIVAIDLLKTEIGLIDPHDLLGPTSSIMPADQFCRSPRSQMRRSEDRRDVRKFPVEDASHQNGNMFLRNRNRPAQNRSIVAPVHTGGNQFAAAKQAFANAAALGAYNGDYYRDKFANQFSSGAKSYEQESKTQQQGLERKTANSSQMDQNQQSSSASSGFNSHCSSQNDSSPASSSSNIASSSSGQADQEMSQAELMSSVLPPPAPPQQKINQRTASDLGPEMIMNRKWALKSTSCARAKNELNKEAIEVEGRPRSVDENKQKEEVLPLAAAKSPRGKRPPKLPHRVGPEMSEPISIPAPPTSAGAGPSGKANLILVSPTGLSPPMPKRSSRTGQPDMADEGELPEFDTIKHIDENGRCNVLKDTNRGPKMPAGIPAYAQLAPPATQRHILRYLMQNTRSNMPDVANHSMPAITAQEVAAVARCRRPLPILPGQMGLASQMSYEHNSTGIRDKMSQADESLYYCGLQARVPIRGASQLSVPRVDRQRMLGSRNAQKTASSLLNEFKQNLRRSHQHQQQQRQQQQINQSHHMSSFSNHQPYLFGRGSQLTGSDSLVGYESCRFIPTSSESALGGSSANRTSSSGRPFLRLFKPSSSNSNRKWQQIQAATSSGSLLSDNNYSKAKSSMFLSADNLPNASTSPSKTSTILSQVGGLLKRSKAKRAAGTTKTAINLEPQER